MKAFFKFLVICSVFFVQLYGLDIKRGWNCIGVSSKISIRDIKKQYPKIDKIFRLSQGVYEDITDKNTLIIKPNDGLLISATSDFKIYFNNRDSVSSKISVNKGWNFKAISMDVSVLAKIFNDKNIQVWIYNPLSRKWIIYKENTKQNINLFIKSMQGFYIYSPRTKIYDLQELSVNLTTFSDKKSMYDFLEKMVILHQRFRSNNAYGAHPPIQANDAVPTAAANKLANADVQNATNTNVQEVGVDEADIIKHNDKNIFYISNNTLYSSSFDEAIQNKNSSKKIDVFRDYKDIHIESLYLHNNKLIVLAKKGYAQFYRSIMPYSQSNNAIYMQIYDVSDIKNIYLLKDIKVDGYLMDSRMSNNKLYLISRFSPYFKVEYQKEIAPCYYMEEPSTVENKVLVSIPKEECFVTNYDKYAIVDKHISPTISIDGSKNDLLDPKKFFALMRVNNFLDITTTISFDLDNLDNDNIDKLSVMLPAQNIYMSSKSLYLYSSYYDTTFDSNFDNVKTLIYKISLSGKLSFIDHIFIDGRALNQFSFSEYNDILRVATTNGSRFKNNLDNMVVAIKENNKELEQIGYLNNLGKTGESIKSVRFIKDKAFLVTFKRTDPFYTIDLSDASNPKKVGELHIPGFSTYLHDIGGGQILALGNDADKDGRVTGMQIQLFDVSDFTKPTVLDKYVFDKTHYSSALYQHKAFTYRASDNKFAMQINSYKSNFYGFYVFKIEDKEIKKVSVIQNNKYFYNGRSVIFTKDNKDYILMLDKTLNVKEIK